jgi:hypothetical protein
MLQSEGWGPWDDLKRKEDDEKVRRDPKTGRRLDDGPEYFWENEYFWEKLAAIGVLFLLMASIFLGLWFLRVE